VGPQDHYDPMLNGMGGLVILMASSDPLVVMLRHDSGGSEDPVAMQCCSVPDGTGTGMATGAS
jgi:hypothetical protein